MKVAGGGGDAGDAQPHIIVHVAALSLRKKRSGTKLEKTSLSAGVF